MKQKKDEAITWIQVNNFIPVIGAALMVATSFIAINGRLDLIEQKVQFVVDTQAEMLTLYKNVENRHGQQALKIERIETILKIN